MAGTRSSTRRANGSSPISSQDNASTSTSSAGTKRKSNAASTPKAKRGKKGGEKKQKTLEETMPDKEENASKDVEMEEATETKATDEEEPRGGQTDDPKQLTKDGGEEEAVTPGAANVKNEDKGKDSNDHEAREGASSKMDETGNIEPEESPGATGGKPTGTEGDAVEESSEREKSTPSSILEKGIIYFFFRGRVGIDEPSDIGDIARSYIVLRPLPHGAKLGDGPIGDAGNNRLLALPKKVLPVSPRDRFMIFVEKANCSMDDIKQTLAASDYATKTAGTRHTPAAAPIGEGIYVITTMGRESHLAYILTIPSELSEVQHDVGLHERGSFVTSVKNPQYAGPANTNLPKGPEFPQEILDEFRSLRWMPLQPKLLDYENTQFLLIGSSVGDLSKATDQQAKDEKHEKDTPLEEMEKLEHEDELRVEHLKGNDTVFEDLGMSSKEYPKLQTTW